MGSSCDASISNGSRGEWDRADGPMGDGLVVVVVVVVVVAAVVVVHARESVRCPLGPGAATRRD